MRSLDSSRPLNSTRFGPLSDGGKLEKPSRIKGIHDFWGRRPTEVASLNCGNICGNHFHIVKTEVAEFAVRPNLDLLQIV
jgi:hypothetical protein